MIKKFLKLFAGCYGLTQSKKACMCLLILICSTIALFHKLLDGTAYAMIVGSITAIYNFCQHRTDIASLPYQYQATLSPQDLANQAAIQQQLKEKYGGDVS